MRTAGFAIQPPHTVEHISYEKRGRAVLEDHFIQRYGVSPFIGLTDAQYQAGIERIQSSIAEAEARGEEAVFKTELKLNIIIGRVPE